MFGYHMVIIGKLVLFTPLSDNRLNENKKTKIALV